MTTLVDKPRTDNIKKYLDFTSKLPGLMAEVGVYKGGTAKIIAQYAPDRELLLFDTFTGMPPVTKEDLHKQGDFSDTSLEAVEKYLKDCNNVTFFKGLFPQETSVSVERASFSFVHLDCDLYESVLNSLMFFYRRMVKGGIIVIDDYNEPTCPGAKKAVDEFLSMHAGGIVSFCQSQVVLYGVC